MKLIHESAFVTNGHMNLNKDNRTLIFLAVCIKKYREDMIYEEVKELSRMYSEPSPWTLPKSAE